MKHSINIFTSRSQRSINFIKSKMSILALGLAMISIQNNSFALGDYEHSTKSDIDIHEKPMLSNCILDISPSLIQSDRKRATKEAERLFSDVKLEPNKPSLKNEIFDK